MEHNNQTTETDTAQVVADFYYTLVLLQTKAVTYVGKGENDHDKVARAKTLTEQFREVVKSIDDIESRPPESCISPCYWDENFRFCICPRLLPDKTGGYFEDLKNQEKV